MAFGGSGVARVGDGAQDRVAAGFVDVAHVEREPDARGDGVDVAGEDVALADGGYGVDGSGGEGGGFNGENDFGGGGEGVSAVGHEECGRRGLQSLRW